MAVRSRLTVCGVLLLLAAAAPGAERPPAWTRAHATKPPMTAAETRAFMKRLARFVYDNHLKTDPKSPQRGMVYEYFHVARKGKFDQWVQGECLDTMHDGAWYAAAMVNAYRATGDRFYKDLLTKWQLPFYCKMLNHSDELFVSSAKRNDARAGAAPWGKLWAFQDGEKGFIPYWWDDGASVSLERRRARGKDNRGHRPCVDYLAGKPNDKGLLSGYSQGMSNHMAQDIGVMVQLAWLLLKDSDDPADRKLAAEVAEAARNLHECRVRHHGPIPMCVAPAALAAGDAKLMRRVPYPRDPRTWTPGRHYFQALYAFQPGKLHACPGFADDQQYRYYYSLAATGGKMTKALAFRTVCDAYTEAMLYRYYSDDAAVPAGINGFDLYPYRMKDGKPTDYRSDRKGPGGRPKPIGSRMGPQNMICCGWAIQALRAFPGVWEEPCRQFKADARVVLPVVVPGSRRDGAKTPRASPPPPTKLRLGGVELALSASLTDLTVTGRCTSDAATIRLYSRPDAKGTHAVISVKSDKTLSAVNDRGEVLLVSGSVRPDREGFAFELSIPYTVAKGQKTWANAVEHGRWSIRAGGEGRNLYFASREKDLAEWLKHELAGGLRTWEAIFDAYGYIPTGIGTGRFWDGYSDSGGYAHLISAAAQWLLCLEGKRDWEVHNIPAVLKADSR